jgi:hypothetical protein
MPFSRVIKQGKLLKKEKTIPNGAFAPKQLFLKYL